MAKIITQETFDDVVKENIVDFSMSAAEARDETIQQFEAQGINLANIIKDLSINEDTGLPLITESLDDLKAHLSGERPLADAVDLRSRLDCLRTECDLSVPHRVLAAKNGTLDVLKAIAGAELAQPAADATDAPAGDDDDAATTTLCATLATLSALIHKQPDIFDPETLIVLMKCLEARTTHTPLVCMALGVVSRACVMHEINRQNIMNAEIMRFLRPLVSSDNAEVVRRLCTVFRSLILDDDVRVEFGKAHDHAKAIAADVLVELTGLMGKFNDNPSVQSELIITVAALTVRNEYCQLVDEAGGLQHVLDAMKKYSDHGKLVREAFHLLKALAGNDVVKARIVELGGAPLITDCLCIHKSNEQLAKVALMCLATMTLRSKENSAALFATDIADEIVEAMRTHPNNMAVLRNGAWAIRNMVSRSRDLCPKFIELGVERVLNEAMQTHPSAAQDLKAALRDLNCDVVLKEEWTGKSTVRMAN